MGMLINGDWRDDDDVARTDPDGAWRRTPSLFRHWITQDGAPGPQGMGGFTAEPGRYHLYAAWNCPWAHRALLARTLLRLEDAVSVSMVAPRRSDQGWVFASEDQYVDDLFGASALHEIYTRSDARYTGRVTVPVLWDKVKGQVVSNESADIVRMLRAFESALDLYPEAHQQDIDDWSARIHKGLNNGVYRTGFATTQAAYDAAVADVFAMLDMLDAHLAARDFIVGEALTEADLRLIPTLVRFDAAYFQAFRCARNRLIDFPHLWGYARRLYQLPGVKSTVQFDIYRAGYNSPSKKRNPHGIIPVAPVIDWSL